MNIGKMMQQAKKMQQNMEKMQEELATLEISGESGGGMVKVMMMGDRSVRSVSIDPAVWDEQDKSLIEDLVAAAFNHASQKVDEASKEKQKSMMAGLPLPPGLSF